MYTKQVVTSPAVIGGEGQDYAVLKNGYGTGLDPLGSSEGQLLFSAGI